MDLFCQKLISKDELAKILEFKYRGGDNSYMYRYIFRPISLFLVEKEIVPKWMAPNIITLSGFFLILLPHFCLILAGAQFGSPSVPAFILPLQIVCLLLYIILDNTDGAQARLRNASSPLGMMFDHQCDSLTSGITFMNVAIYIGFNNISILSTAMICVVNLFSVHVILEYLLLITFLIISKSSLVRRNYEDGLFLGVVNAPNEGFIPIFSILFLTYLNDGVSFWISNTIFGLSYGSFTSLVLIFVSIGMFLSVFAKCSRLKSVSQVLWSMRSNLALSFASLAFILLAPEVSFANFRALGYILTFHFSILNGLGQISHAAHVEIKQHFPMTTATIVVLPFAGLLGQFYAVSCLWILAGVSLVSYLSFAISVSKQLSELFGIKVFKITPKRSPSE